MIDSDGQLILGQTIFLGHQLPSPFNGIGFEIVAKREIAEHFKKCVMAGSIAHIIKIIMLAASADAFLRGGGARVGAFFGSGKYVLELHNA